MEDTPRHMSTLGTQTLRRLIPALEDVYTHPPLIALLSSVYGTRILPLPEDAVDRFVFNHLHRAGDTHGAHFDDYPISFVFVFEAPHESQGGYVEICPNAASVHDIEGPKAQRIVLGEGDAYLLQSDTTAHRVAPITSSASRTALNFAYTTESFTPRMVTQSAQVLYS
ncbi:MAG TPA: hypothetical protein VH165_12630 [Kofleriaceae bacterium]|nr:hypothetical protein [Kofleriaceae bacterium]